MAKMKCPYCDVKFGDKHEYSKHVTVHVVDTIRKSYPGLLEMIEKVESEMPVRFWLKLDAEKAALEEGIANTIMDNMDKEGKD